MSPFGLEADIPAFMALVPTHCECSALQCARFISQDTKESLHPETANPARIIRKVHIFADELATMEDWCVCWQSDAFVNRPRCSVIAIKGLQIGVGAPKAGSGL